MLPQDPNASLLARALLQKVDLSLLDREGFRPQLHPSECLVLLHIHALPSNVWLLERLIRLGFRPQSIIVVPKKYSTIPPVQQQIRELGCVFIDTDLRLFRPGSYDQYAERTLQQAVLRAQGSCHDNIRRCILVDCGGMLTDNWSRLNKRTPPDTISVQQTTSGLNPARLRSAVHRISVATSAAKRIFEPKTIVDGVLRKVSDLRLLDQDHRVAVIGLGAIGSRLAKELVATQRQIFTYDIIEGKNVPGTVRKSSWQECVNAADIVFGCTGRNFMHADIKSIREMRRQKKFVSLSSRDIEFKSLLNEYRGTDPYNSFANIRVCVEKHISHTVLNGGFPINFDRKREWEEGAEISLTRAIVVLGVLQSLCIPVTDQQSIIEKLALKSQQRLSEEWLKINNYSPSDFFMHPEYCRDNRWWSTESRLDAEITLSQTKLLGVSNRLKCAS